METTTTQLRDGGSGSERRPTKTPPRQLPCGAGHVERCPALYRRKRKQLTPMPPPAQLSTDDNESAQSNPPQPTLKEWDGWEISADNRKAIHALALTIDYREPVLPDDEVVQHGRHPVQKMGLLGLVNQDWAARLPKLIAEYILHRDGVITSKRMAALNTSTNAFKKAYGMVNGKVPVSSLDGVEYRALFMDDKDSPPFKYDAVQDVNQQRDNAGLSFSRKAMIRCGVSLDVVGYWHIGQLTPELQAIIALYRNHFDVSCDKTTTTETKLPDWLSWLEDKTMCLLGNLKSGCRMFVGAPLYHLCLAQGLISKEEKLEVELTYRKPRKSRSVTMQDVVMQSDGNTGPSEGDKTTTESHIYGNAGNADWTSKKTNAGGNHVADLGTGGLKWPLLLRPKAMARRVRNHSKFDSTVGETIPGGGADCTSVPGCSTWDVGYGGDKEDSAACESFELVEGGNEHEHGDGDSLDSCNGGLGHSTPDDEPVCMDHSERLSGDPSEHRFTQSTGGLPADSLPSLHSTDEGHKTKEMAGLLHQLKPLCLDLVAYVPISPSSVPLSGGGELNDDSNGGNSHEDGGGNVIGDKEGITKTPAKDSTTVVCLRGKEAHAPNLESATRDSAEDTEGQGVQSASQLQTMVQAPDGRQCGESLPSNVLLGADYDSSSLITADPPAFFQSIADDLTYEYLTSLNPAWRRLRRDKVEGMMRTVTGYCWQTVHAQTVIVSALARLFKCSRFEDLISVVQNFVENAEEWKASMECLQEENKDAQHWKVSLERVEKEKSAALAQYNEARCRYEDVQRLV